MNETNILCSCGNAFEFPFFKSTTATCLACGAMFLVVKVQP